MNSELLSHGALVAAIIALAEVIKMLLKRLGREEAGSNPGNSGAVLKDMNSCLVSIKLGIEGIKGSVDALRGTVVELDKTSDRMHDDIKELLVRTKIRDRDGSNPVL